VRRKTGRFGTANGAAGSFVPYALNVRAAVSVIRCSRDHMRRCNVIKQVGPYHNHAQYVAARIAPRRSSCQSI